MTRDHPFRSQGFWIGEALLVALGLFTVGTMFEFVYTSERTTCVVGHNPEYDPDESGRATVTCPATNDIPSGESITVYVDGSNRSHVHTRSDLADWLASGVIILIIAVVWPVVRWIRWRDRLARAHNVEDPERLTSAV